MGDSVQNPAWEACLDPLERAARRWGGPVLLAVGIVVCLGLGLYSILSPTRQRAAPLEPDDAYGYIVKAAEVQSCFRQDCAAINDLRLQVVLPVADDEAAFERHRQQHRVISFYTPLYSVLLLAIHKAGLGWEAACLWLQLAGVVFVGLAMAAFLAALWGSGPAGFAMLLLAVTVVMRGSAPSNLATGAAFLTWAFVVRRRGPSPWAVLLGVAAMLALHPIGRLLSFLSIVAYFLFADRSRPARRWIVSAAGLALIAVVFALPLIISHPDLRIAQDPAPQGWTRVRGVVENGIVALKIVTEWIGWDPSLRLREMGGAAGGLILIDFAFLIVAGLATVCRENRPKILILGGLLLLSLPVGFVYVLPHYPAEAFARLSAALAVLVAGAVGQAAWVWVTAALQWLRDAAGGKAGYRLDEQVDTRRVSTTSNDKSWSGGWWFVFVLLTAMVFCRYCASTVPTKIRQIAAVRSAAVTRGDVFLHPPQVEVLRANARPGDRVLYLDETTLYLYLSYGAFDLGAVCLPGLRNTPDEAAWLDKSKNIRFLAGLHPGCVVPMKSGHGLSLRPGAKIDVHSETPLPLSSVRFRLANMGEDATLAIQIPDTLGTTTPVDSVALTVPARSSEWFPIPGQNHRMATRFAVQLARGRGPVYLLGLQDKPDARLNWPWDRGLSITYTVPGYQGKVIHLPFASQALCPSLRRPIDVLDDTGSTILAKVADP